MPFERSDLSDFDISSDAWEVFLENVANNRPSAREFIAKMQECMPGVQERFLMRNLCDIALCIYRKDFAHATQKRKRVMVGKYERLFGVGS